MKPGAPLFSPESPAGTILAAWWQGLENDRGARAQLRRARTPEDAALVPATIELITRLRATPITAHRGWMARMPMIAGLASHLDSSAHQTVLTPPDPARLPQLMAQSKGDRPRVSELRFRRLLRTSRDGLYQPMIRILAQLDHQACLFDLADALFWWGPQIHKAWAFVYFPALKKTA